MWRMSHVRAQDYRRARYLEAKAIQMMVFGRAIWPQLPDASMWRWTHVTTDNVAGTALSPCGHRLILPPCLVSDVGPPTCVCLGRLHARPFSVHITFVRIDAHYMDVLVPPPASAVYDDRVFFARAGRPIQY